ncbi:DUF6173 family protein [Primorskyibacter flagellatus]|uniref:DUF6173 family protein n=1 Tax=Primorskyibacter flagellatus TaxID=1387277 RepID=UPI003A92D082
MIETSAEYAENDALPRRHEVHTNGEEGCSGAADLPQAVQRKPLKHKSQAEWAYERLVLYIQSFEEQLDNEHEVAMGLAGGQVGVLRIEGMGFFDPDILTFYGSEPGGKRTQLIQHVSQLNVMLRAVPKEPEQANAQRIGFRLVQELDKA